MYSSSSGTFNSGTGSSTTRPRPAPIFAKKRPRLALIAHPNNSQSNPNSTYNPEAYGPKFTPRSNVTQRSSAGEFRGHYPQSCNNVKGSTFQISRPQQNTASRFSAQHNQEQIISDSTNKAASDWSSCGNSNILGTDSAKSPYGYTPTQPKRFGAQPDSPSPALGQPAYGASSHITPGNQYQLSLPSAVTPSNIYQHKTPGMATPSNTYQHKTSSMATPSNTYQHKTSSMAIPSNTYQQKATPMATSGYPQRNASMATQMNKYQQKASNMATSNKRGFQDQNVTTSRQPSAGNKPKSVTTNWQPQSKKQIGKPQADKEATDDRLKTLDCSMKIITATIQGMKYWVQYTNKVPITFEIYGILNSAVSSCDSNRAKEFSLKDDRDNVPCKFYIIDRPFPRITRGQWLRCMGTLDRDKGLFHCVSIRPAVEAERRLQMSAVTASDAAMRDWVKMSKLK